jgi:hypothetical protein
LELLNICVLDQFTREFWEGTWARVDRHTWAVKGSFGMRSNIWVKMQVALKLMGIMVEEMVGKMQVFRVEICRGLVEHTFGTFCVSRCC